jgi:protein-S-isoprenylcysteine O-methyltransferase Ste14
MNISKYQKVFGIGPLSLALGLLLLGILWLMDRKLDHLSILRQPRPVRIFGLVLIGIWVCWHVWCLRTIRLWWRGNQLCTTGPYRLVRHPIYAGGVMFGFMGVCLMFNSWILLLSPVLQYIILSLLVRKEEMMMTAVFGEEYGRYAARTGRFFPRFPKI